MYKTPPGPHMNSLKRFQEMFCFREYIREKACVNIVIAHADIVSA